MKFNRREFLALFSGFFGGVLTAGMSTKPLGTIMQKFRPEFYPPTGPESFMTTICGACPGGCGLLVRKIGDRAVKIEGNPLYPVNRGGTCPKAQASLQELDHAERIRTPLRRIKPGRGKDAWQPISWEEAQKELDQSLRELRDGGNPERLLFVTGENRGLTHDLAQQFCQSYGTPNFFRLNGHQEIGDLSLLAGHGAVGSLAYDLENTDCILSFGVPVLEGWGSPVYAMRAFGHMRQGREGNRGILIQVDSRLSATAASADRWIPLKPGTEAALALGMARVIVSENLYDEKFVAKHAYGFEDFTDAKGNRRRGFRSFVLRDYPLEEVSRITGIKPETILETARTFARKPQAVAIVDRNIFSQPHGEQAAFAIHCLNALVGSIDRPGGVLIQEPLPSLWKLISWKADEIGRKGFNAARLDGVERKSAPVVQKPGNLPQALKDKKPYAIELAIIHRCNPLFNGPNLEVFREALAPVRKVISFSSFLDETSEAAHLILPEHHFLERLEDNPTPPTVAFRVCGIRQPVIKPLYQTRHSADVILEAAQHLGNPVTQALPWKNMEQLLQLQVKTLLKSGAGAVVGFHREESWLKLLVRSGWQPPRFSNEVELLNEMKDKGGWWDPYYSFGNRRRIYKNPSRKFEFFSVSLAKLSPKKTDGSEFFPRQVETQKEKESYSKEYPLTLNLFVPLSFMGGTGAHLPFLQETAGVLLQEQWGTWAEINPHTAKEFRLQDGQKVWIESARGKVKAKLRFFEGAIPGLINVPVGQGQSWGKLSGSQEVGSNPLKILLADVAQFSGMEILSETQVKLIHA